MQRNLRSFVRSAGRIVRRFQTWTVPAGPAAGMRIGRLNASSDYGDPDIERPVQDAVSSALKPGDVFYDIGANVGFFTLVASRCVGPNGHIHAFEPRSSNVGALRANLERNDLHDVEVWPVAVGAHDGVVDLFCADHPGGATVERSAAVAVTHTEPVEMVTIDQLVTSRRIGPPDVVKIDVEGAELAVIEGMTSTIQHHRPVIVYELDGPEPDPVEHTDVEIRELLGTLGYRVDRLRDSYTNIPWYVLHSIARPTGAEERDAR